MLPVTFPDFTRGFWNKEEGYKHQYASPEDEAATEAAAAAYTKAQKEATAKYQSVEALRCRSCCQEGKQCQGREERYCQVQEGCSCCQEGNGCQEVNKL